MPSKLLRLPMVMEITGKRKTSIYADMKAGKFPKSFSIGGRAIAWLEQDIEAWIEERIREGQNRRAA